MNRIFRAFALCTLVYAGLTNEIYAAECHVKRPFSNLWYFTGNNTVVPMTAKVTDLNAFLNEATSIFDSMFPNDGGWHWGAHPYYNPTFSKPRIPAVGFAAWSTYNNHSAITTMHPTCPAPYTDTQHNGLCSGPRHGFPSHWSWGWYILDGDNLGYTIKDYDSTMCGKKAKDLGPPQCEKSVGNPINIGSGNKFQIETIYANGAVSPLQFKVAYNSSSLYKGTLGANRRSNYDRSIGRVSSYDNGYFEGGYSAYRPDGKSYYFSEASPTSPLVADGDIQDRLEKINDSSGNFIGWRLITSDDETEIYNADGNLISITGRSGLALQLTYSDAATPQNIAPSPGMLIQVSDSFGRNLDFTINPAGRISTMTDPAGGTYAFSYDSYDNLLSITFPGLTVRQFLYETPSLKNALTGIVDENGTRFATFTYDTATGKALSTEHAGGAQKYSVTYPQATQSIVTDPLGAVRTYNFQSILGILKPTSQSQPGGSGCGPASNALAYDANGNVASRTDFSGNKTCYAYDLTRNLQTARIEGMSTGADCAAALASASLTPPMRRVTTQWHAQYRLAAIIAEPLSITTNTYDNAGNLSAKSVQATSDATGSQGLAAATNGVLRTWSYTHNSYGQVLTATGPRSDIIDTTTFVYDSMGNLATSTNSVGHVTTYSNYDANGRVGKIVDANGLITDFLYHPRGWLANKTVTGTGINEITGYDYDSVGQLKKVNLPNGSWVGYDYDDAHRLTDLYDSVGSRITYTLDAAGNRLKEEVKDPGGTLTRQSTRIYDSLNRMQTMTGGTQ